ncbi:hypothetical protein ACFQ21_06185 [Ohtaekwangia kribbensis]|jgi:hypothetical protein|uniref:Uncharacterized protein n=1 Tax=Ohtaekwangia kribbensis TaxID=688913 RepID=A0ABW3JZD3_9BACT
MKTAFYCILLSFIALTGFRNYYQGENIEFSCMKTHKASNTCHFNFKVDGAKYRYVDIGCKFSSKRDEVIKKAKEGTIALSRDWKIECPEPKEQKPDGGL